MICGPLHTLRERDEGRLVQMIAEVVVEKGVSKIVVGLPRPLSGGTNAQLQSVLSFKGRLAAAVGVPVLTWDERFTSKLAEKGGTSTAERDSVAASYMLQNYLDSRTDATEDEETHEQQIG
jgi:putative Holliday junction resolvase